jgi:hypothetical protein
LAQPTRSTATRLASKVQLGAKKSPELVCFQGRFVGKAGQECFGLAFGFPPEAHDLASILGFDSWLRWLVSVLGLDFIEWASALKEPRQPTG